MIHARSLSLAALTFVLALACSEEAAVVNPPPGEIAVKVTPANVNLGFGQQQRFLGSVTGTTDSRVSWSLPDPSSGTIDAEGVYTPPQAAGTFRVVATSVAEATRSAAATVNVRPAPAEVSVTVDPDSAVVVVGRTQPFTATVRGTTKTLVTWQVIGGGTVSQTGLYTAPSSPGTAEVVATSVADGTKAATATVTVVPVPKIHISPLPKTVFMKETLQLSARLLDGTPVAVTWALLGKGPGSVSPTGLYTAPATPNDYHVVATSLSDPTVTGTGTIKVPPLDIQVSPKMASVALGSTQQFTVEVSGITNKAVEWITSGGTLTPNSQGALFSSPNASGTFMITAASVEEPTSDSSTTITVTSNVTVEIVGGDATVRADKTLDFDAAVTGAANMNVTWTAVKGTIKPDGHYTPPEGEKVDTVTATSVADTTKTSSITVSILDAPGPTPP